MSVEAKKISTSFIWRRVHSLTGLWLVLYLFLHLVTNSQAALWLGESGAGFVRMVNSLESLPYLHFVEVTLIGLPLVIHGVWGVQRAMQARLNSNETNGSKPAMTYERNRAFTLQRLTSWILLFGIIGHVVQMRFIDQPKRVSEEQWSVVVLPDEKLVPLASRWNVQLMTAGEKVRAVADSPGTAMLLMVRDTFKSPLMVALYTIFVLAAAYHAANGFWTFLITWGAILSYRSQRAMIPVSVIGIGVLTFLGLAAIWGSYYG